MLPSTYRPKSSDDFIGPARSWAVHLEKLVALAKINLAPLRVLLLGQPGVGKSQLAEYFIRLTGAGKFSVSRYNGTGFRIDEAEAMRRQFQLRDMFGGYRVLQIEECDKVPTVAQVALLTLLDDLPEQTAVIATSNCKLKDFEIRFQRRFHYCEIEGPSDKEMLAFIRQRWPEVPLTDAKRIATFSCGNVGSALNDLDLALVQSQLKAA